MESESDIMLRMMLDITNVEENLETVKSGLASLPEAAGNIAALSAAFNTLSENIGKTTVAFNATAAAISKSTGVKAGALNADVALARAENNAATATRLRAQAELQLQRAIASRVAAQAIADRATAAQAYRPAVNPPAYKNALDGMIAAQNKFQAAQERMAAKTSQWTLQSGMISQSKRATSELSRASRDALSAQRDMLMAAAQVESSMPQYMRQGFAAEEAYQRRGMVEGEKKTSRYNQFIDTERTRERGLRDAGRDIQGAKDSTGGIYDANEPDFYANLKENARRRAQEARNQARRYAEVNRVSPNAVPNAPGGAWRDSPYTRNGTVSYVPLDFLAKIQGNDLGKTDIEALKADIKANGLNEPLTAIFDRQDDRAYLGEGNHRAEALRQLGYTYAPVRGQSGYVREDMFNAVPVKLKRDENGYTKGEQAPGDFGFPTWNPAENLGDRTPPPQDRGYNALFDKLDERDKIAEKAAIQARRYATVNRAQPVDRGGEEIPRVYRWQNQEGQFDSPDRSLYGSTHITPLDPEGKFDPHDSIYVRDENTPVGHEGGRHYVEGYAVSNLPFQYPKKQRSYMDAENVENAKLLGIEDEFKILSVTPVPKLREWLENRGGTPEQLEYFDKIAERHGGYTRELGRMMQSKLFADTLRERGFDMALWGDHEIKALHPTVLTTEPPPGSAPPDFNLIPEEGMGVPKNIEKLFYEQQAKYSEVNDNLSAHRRQIADRAYAGGMPELSIALRRLSELPLEISSLGMGGFGASDRVDELVSYTLEEIGNPKDFREKYNSKVAQAAETWGADKQSEFDYIPESLSQLGGEYQHTAPPTYNPLQYHAQRAYTAFVNEDFEGAATHLQTIKKSLSEGTAVSEAASWYANPVSGEVLPYAPGIEKRRFFTSPQAPTGDRTPPPQDRGYTKLWDELDARDAEQQQARKQAISDRLNNAAMMADQAYAQEEALIAKASDREMEKHRPFEEQRREAELGPIATEEFGLANYRLLSSESLGMGPENFDQEPDYSKLTDARKQRLQNIDEMRREEERITSRPIGSYRTSDMSYAAAWEQMVNTQQLEQSLHKTKEQLDQEDRLSDQARRTQERMSQRSAGPTYRSSDAAAASVYGPMFDDPQTIEQKAKASAEALNKAQTDRMTMIRNSQRMFEQQVSAAGGPEKFADKMNQESGYMVTNAREVRQAREAFTEYTGARGRAFATWASQWGGEFARLNRHIVQIGLIGLAFGAVTEAVSAYARALQGAQEFQIQGVLFKNYRESITTANPDAVAKGQIDQSGPNDLMRESIKLAAAYGDNVNDVSQDLALWYKRTGDLAAASYMTAQALEFQNATGTHLEDTYRTLTALSSQLTGSNFGDKQGVFDLTKTHQLLNNITAAAVDAGAGLHQANDKGFETDTNSANILIQNMEKDSAALRSLGFSVNQTIALNAALIQSFGNTGSGASEAAEKIGRLAGGLNSLADPSKNKALLKDGIDLSKLTTAPAGKQQLDILEQLAEVYEKLSGPEQRDLANKIAGQRQYEALIAIMENLAKARKIEHDMVANQNIEDKIAADMQDTLEKSTARLQGAIQGIEIEAGQRLIPTLTDWANAIATNVIPQMNALIDHAGLVTTAITTIVLSLGALSIGGPILAGAVALAGAGVAVFENQQDQRAKERALYGKDAALLPYINNQDRYFGKNGGPLGRTEGGLSATEQAARALPEGVTPEDLAAARERINHVNAALAQYNSITRQSGPVDANNNTQAKIDQMNKALNDQGKTSAFKFVPKYQNSSAYNFRNLTPNDAAYNAIQHEEQMDSMHDPATYRAIQQQLTDKQAEALRRAVQPQKTTPTDGNLTGPQTATSTNKPLKDYQAAADSLTNMREQFALLNADMAEQGQIDDAAVAHQERLNRSYGLTGAAVFNLDKALAAKRVHDEDTITQMEKEQAAFTKAAEHAKAMAKAFGDTQEGKGWTQQYRTATNDVVRLAGEIRRLNTDIESTRDKSIEAHAALARTNTENILKPATAAEEVLQKEYSTTANFAAKASIAKRELILEDATHKSVLAELASQYSEADKATQVYQNALTTEEDRHKRVTAAIEDENRQRAESRRQESERIESKGQGYTDRTIDALIGASGLPTGEEDYLRREVSLLREAQQARKEYNDEMVIAGNDAGLQAEAEASYKLAQGMLAAQDAADKFKEKLDALKASDWYDAVIQGLDSIASALANEMGQNLFGGTALQDNIEYLRNYAQRLEDAKTFQDEMYSAETYHSLQQERDHKLYLILMDEKIRKIKEQQAAEQYAAAHPPLAKKLAEDFTKSFVDSYMKKAIQNMMGGLTADPNAQDIKNNLESYIQATLGPQKESFATYKTTTETLIQGFRDFDATIKDSLLNPNYTGTVSTDNPIGMLVDPNQMANVAIDTNKKVAATYSGGTSILDSLFPGVSGNYIGAQSQLMRQAVAGGINDASTASSHTADMPNAGGGSWAAPGGIAGIFGGVMGGINKTVASLGGWGQLATEASLAAAGSSKSVLGADMTTAGSILAGMSKTVLPNGSISTGLQSNWGSGSSNLAGGLETAGNIFSAFSQSTDAGIGSLVGGGLGAWLGGPAGAALGSSLGGMVGGLFGPHYSPTTNPDMYANDGYAQAMANAGGVAGTAANGTVYEDPMLSQELGGMTEFQYVDKFVQAHPGGAGLDKTELQLWNQLNTLTGGGQATQFGGLHQGNITAQNAAGQNVGATGNWQQLAQELQQATAALAQFNSAAQESLVVFNQYGAGSGFFTYNWNTPGYQFPSSAYSSGGANTANNPINSSGLPSKPGYNNGYGNSQNSGNNYRGLAAAGMLPNIVLNITAALDGKALAKSSQAYTLQAQAQGYTLVS